VKRRRPPKPPGFRRPLTAREQMELRAFERKLRVLQHTEHFTELHRLLAEKLIVRGPRCLEFPQPDHLRVTAWRSHPLPAGNHMRDRDWLLCEINSMISQAKARRPEAVESLAELGMNVLYLPITEVREHLSWVISGDCTVH
jgi:hypothetical protein